MPPSRLVDGAVCKEASLLAHHVLNNKTRGEPLQNLGFARAAGFALKFEGPSPSGSYQRDQPFPDIRPDQVDSRSMQAALAWVSGVFAVKMNYGTIPKFVQASLDRRRGGWYTLRAYTPLKVARYLVSLDVKRQGNFRSIWTCRYNLLTRHPTVEFSDLVSLFEQTLKRPSVAKQNPLVIQEVVNPAEPTTTGWTGFVDFDGNNVTEEVYRRIVAELEASW